MPAEHAVEYVPPWKMHELVEMRDFVKALPVGARRVLRGGPLKEPDCVVCTALAAVDGCASFADEIRSYHEVSLFDVATWSGIDFETIAEYATGETGDGKGTGVMYEAMRGALQAERCAVLCLLAGWVPPRIRLPRDWRETGV